MALQTVTRHGDAKNKTIHFATSKKAKYEYIYVIQPNDGFPEGQAPVVLDTLSTGEIDYIKYYTKYRNKKNITEAL